MEWIPLTSRLISRIRHFAEFRALEVELQGGNIYQFFEVPRVVFEELKTSESPGRYFNENIKEVFDFKRL